MKKIILFLFGSVFMIYSCTQTAKKNEDKKDTVQVITPHTVEEKNQLSEVITRFVRGYLSQDNGKVNALVHPDLGFTIIYRPGVSDVFVTVDSIDFKNPIPAHYAYETFSNDHVLTYDRLPTFDCGTEKWDKLGFFCDTTSHPTQISNIISFENEFEKNKYSRSIVEGTKADEGESFRVILTGKTALVFHVQKYKGNWYVSTLDRAYGGCDA